MVVAVARVQVRSGDGSQRLEDIAGPDMPSWREACAAVEIPEHSTLVAWMTEEFQKPSELLNTPNGPDGDYSAEALEDVPGAVRMP